MALKILMNIPGHYLKNSHRTGLLNPGLFGILLGRSYTQQLSDQDGKTEVVAPLPNPEVTDTEVRTVRRRRTSIVKHAIYRERLEKFLLEKGADQLTIEDIISRYPKSITLRFKDIAEVWELWQSVLEAETSILMIIERSPESFFRSGGVEKLSENLSLLYSLGLTPKILKELVVKSPRTLSYSVELNKEKVGFLRELCVRMGGEDPDDFVRQVITSNIFILTRSTKRLKANVESIQSLMKLENQDLLSWLQGEAAHVLNLCNMYLEENFLHIHQKMQSLGYLEEDVTRYIIKCPSVLLLSPNVFTCKVNLLLECGIETKRILDTPSLLEVSLATLRNKVKVLEQLGYNFRSNGPGILLLSKSRFVPKLEKLAKLQT